MKTLIVVILFSFWVVPEVVFSQVADCNKFCVRELQLNPENLNELLVKIYFADNNNDFINQTYLHEILDSDGTQIAGKGSFFQFYGHSAFTNKTYTLPTDLQKIPEDLSGTVVLGYTDYFNETSKDQVCRIPFPCQENLSLIRAVTLYPNPAQEAFTLSFDNPNRESHDLTIFDFFGIQQFQIIGLKGESFYKKRDDLPNGIYVIQLKQGDKIRWTGKLILD